MTETKNKNVFKSATGGIVKYFKETKAELKKVTWPTIPQVINNTMVVIAAIAVVCAFLFIVDTIFGGTISGIVKGDMGKAFADIFKFGQGA